MLVISWIIPLASVLALVFGLWAQDWDWRYGDSQGWKKAVVVVLAVLFSISAVAALMATIINVGVPIERQRTQTGTESPIALTLGSRISGGGGFLSFFVNQDGWFFYDTIEMSGNGADELLLKQTPVRDTRVYLAEGAPVVKAFRVEPIPCWRTRWFGKGADTTGSHPHAGTWTEWEIWTPQDTVVQGVRIDPKDLS